MAYTFDDWKDRIRSRIDLCTQVTHLTKGATIDGIKYSPLKILIKILNERTIIGSDTAEGFIVGNRRAVCFMDAPLYSICENTDFEKELRKRKLSNRIKYMPFGLMFPKRYIYLKGGRPVIYDKTDVAKSYLNEDEWWRIVRFDLSEKDSIIDWTHEREWRLPGEFKFDINKATVVVPNTIQYNNFFKEANEVDEEIANNINSIVNLATLFL